MNCKRGDLAMYVGAWQEMRGQVFRCICLSPKGALLAGEPVWTVTPNHAYGHDMVRDSSLRPIRPDGITNEEVKELFSPSPAKESEKV